MAPLHVTLITLKTPRTIKDRSKKMRTQEALQRSRGRYLKPAPEKLKQLIELVNALPPVGSLDSRFLHPHHLRAQTNAELETRGGDENPFFGIFLARLIVEELQIKKVSPFLLDYVAVGVEEGGLTSNRMMKDGGVVGRYENLWNARVRLHNMAQLAKVEDEQRSERSTLWREAVPLPVLDEIDERGIVRVSKDLFTEAMDEEPVEAARIRECAVCNRIFFAGRIDARQCGDPKCKSALSSRLNRNPELRELYNKARRTKRRKLNGARKRTSE
jgi:hypothetical protein